MKVNEDKLVQIAVDYVTALLSENGARVINTSPRGIVFEADEEKWELQIEKRDFFAVIPPHCAIAHVLATFEILHDAVEGVERGDAIDLRRNVQDHKLIKHGKEWMFEITADRKTKRLQLGGEVSDNSQMAVAVLRRYCPDRDDARALAESLVEMCNALITKSLWTVQLYQYPASCQERILCEQEYEVFGVSHLLMAMIKILTKRNLLPPGHGLRGFRKVRLE